MIKLGLGIFALVLAAQSLAGCALEQPMAIRIGSTRALATPADVRIITERDQPSATSKILCAEPSPDISKALSTLAKVSGGSGSVQAGGAVSTAESISILAGRTAGVVALRDGLFRACEAYANGIIGRRAYSLILSQYGNLLVTLMLSEDASGAGGVAAASRGPTPTAATVDINFPSLAAKPAAAQPAAPAAPAVTPAAPSGGAQNTLSPPQSPTPDVSLAEAADAFGQNASTNPANGTPAAPAADANAAANGAANSPPANGTPALAATPTTDQGADIKANTLPADGPAAVSEIAKFYFDSGDHRSSEAEFTACIADEAGLDSSTPGQAKHLEGNRIDKFCVELFNSVIALATVKIDAEKATVRSQVAAADVAEWDAKVKVKADQEALATPAPKPKPKVPPKKPAKKPTKKSTPLAAPATPPPVRHK